MAEILDRFNVKITHQTARVNDANVGKRKRQQQGLEEIAKPRGGTTSTDVAVRADGLIEMFGCRGSRVA